MGHTVHQYQPHGADVSKGIPLVKNGTQIHQHQAHGADDTKEIHRVKNGTPNSPVLGSRKHGSTLPFTNHAKLPREKWDTKFAGTRLTEPM